jgi:VanZ family protein
MTAAWFRQWGPAILLMVIIFIISATPGSDLPRFGRWDVIVKKGGHMIGYALLACAYLHALDRHRHSTRFCVLSAAFLALLYAASDEYHQRFTPGRTASIHDVFIDLTGAAIGLSLLTWDRKRLEAGKQKSESGN